MKYHLYLYNIKFLSLSYWILTEWNDLLRKNKQK